jgi:hypothetical protein
MHFSSSITFVLRTQQNHTISSMNTCISVPALHLYINTFPHIFSKIYYKNYITVACTNMFLASSSLKHLATYTPGLSSHYYGHPTNYICVCKIVHPPILYILVIGPSFSPYIAFLFSLVFPLAANVKS